MYTKIIDLSHTICREVSIYPGTPAPSLEDVSSFDEDGYREFKMTLVSHIGTHIDAPAHVVKNGKSLDKYDLDKFIGNAIVIDCREENELTMEVIKKYEQRIKKVDFVLFYTGWQDRWNTDRYLEDCPVPSPEVSEWLAQFDLKGIGIDSFSVDKIVHAKKVTTITLPNHHIFLGKDIILIENLSNLDKLPGTFFTFQCFPLKFSNADGSPVRALAII